MRARWHTFSSLILFFVALAFYLYTLAPSLTWGDGVRLQTEVALGGSVYLFFEEAQEATPVDSDSLPFAKLGVAAWDHPLYVMIGQPFLALPWGDVAFRVNLISALAGALVVTLMYQLGKRLVSDPRAALMGTLAFAVSHTFWWHATDAEVYTLHLLFMTGLIAFALRWSRERRWYDLLWFALLAGLGLANHVMLVLTLIPAIVFMAAVAARNAHLQFRVILSPRTGWQLARSLANRRSVACIGVFLAGFSPWWIQFLRMSRLIGTPLTLALAFGFPSLPHEIVFASIAKLGANLLAYLAWLLYQFTPVGVMLGAYGFLIMLRSRSRAFWLLSALFIVHVAFSANFSVGDQWTFHLPSYLLFALYIMWGLTALFRKIDLRLRDKQRWIHAAAFALLTAWFLVVPIVVYALTPSLLRAVNITDQKAGIYPIGAGARDGLSVFLNPNRRDDNSAAQFGLTTLEQLAPNALVFAPNNVDGEAYLTLRYYQLVEHLRSDVRLELMLFHDPSTMQEDILSLVHQQIACHPVYLLSLNPAIYSLVQLQADFEITKEANIFRLLPRYEQASTGACPVLDQSQAGRPLQQLMSEAIRWR